MEALERQQIVDRQCVEVTRTPYELELVEAVDELLANAVDIHRAARDEVLDALDIATRAARVDAEVLRVLLVLDHRLAARGTVGWHLEDRLVARSILEHGADHLRDHVAGALHDDGVADADVLAVDVFLVVQRGVPHDDAADLDGLELGKRVEGAGAPHVDFDAEQLRRARRRREFEGDRPARIAADGAERGLQCEAVDLHDRTVDVVPERFAVVLDGVARLADGLDAGHRLDARVDGETTRGEPLERLVV